MSFPSSTRKSPNVFIDLYDDTGSMKSVSSYKFTTKVINAIPTTVPGAPTNVVAILISDLPGAPTNVVAILISNLPTVPIVPIVLDTFNGLFNPVSTTVPIVLYQLY